MARLLHLLTFFLLTLGLSSQVDAQDTFMGVTDRGDAWSIQSDIGDGLHLGPVGFDKVKDLTSLNGEVVGVGVGPSSTQRPFLFKIDATTGRGTHWMDLIIPPNYGVPVGLAADSRGTLFLHSDLGYLFTVDLLTGKAQHAGKTAAFDVVSMTWFQGNLWFWDTRRGVLYQDPAGTVYAEEVATGQVGTAEIQAIEFDTRGFLFGAGVGYWSVDLTNGKFINIQPNPWPSMTGMTLLDADPPNGPFYEISNLVSGQTATLRATQAGASNSVIFAWSFAGAGPTNTPFGPVDLSMPISQIPPIPTDSNGEVNLPVAVPAGLSGVAVWSQALVLLSQGGGVFTNPLAEIVQ